MLTNFSYKSSNDLLITSKSFIRPYLDYGGILNDKPNNENFQNKIELEFTIIDDWWNYRNFYGMAL